MPYIVHATPPAKENFKSGWDFRDGFFPRRTHYLKDALEYKAEAEKKGGTDVRIEKA
jgi:hypothetical protein